MRGQMNCDGVRALLPALLAAEQQTEISQAVREHLRSCGDCRETLGGYFPLEQWLEGIPCARSAPPGFTAAVMARLAGEAVAPSAAAAPAKSGPVRRRMFLHYLAAGAATVLLMLSGFFQLFADMGAKGAWLNRQADALNTRVRQIQPKDTGGPSIWQRIWQSGMDIFNFADGSEKHGEK